MTDRWIRLVGFVFLVSTILPVGSDALRAQAPAAQPPAAQPPQRISVTVIHVKPEMIGAYQALAKAEGVPAEKKAGLAWRHTYGSSNVGELGVFIIVRPVTSLAQYDQPGPIERALGAEGAAKFLTKTRSMIVSQRNMIQVMQPNLSIESGATDPPKLVVVQNVELHPDKGPAFNDLMERQIVPAFKKIGVKDYWVFNTLYGGPFQMRTIVEPIANFASLEPAAGQVGGRLARAVGAEAAARINAQRYAMTQRQETTVMRLVPDLTFTTPTQRTSR